LWFFWWFLMIWMILWFLWWFMMMWMIYGDFYDDFWWFGWFMIFYDDLGGKLLTSVDHLRHSLGPSVGPFRLKLDLGSMLGVPGNPVGDVGILSTSAQGWQRFGCILWNIIIHLYTSN
jgi:hypothetical protein